MNLSHSLEPDSEIFLFPGTSGLLRQNNPVVLIHSCFKQSIYLAYVVQLNCKETQVHSTITYSTNTF